MDTRLIFSCWLLVCFSGIASAQHGVDPTHRYHRLICLVHLTGSGTQDDPILPEYAPQPANSASPVNSPSPANSTSPRGTSVGPTNTSAAAVVARPGILAWSSQLTDDKKMVIVHYVAADRNAFASILADTRPEIRVFEIGLNTRAEIEAEMQKYKKGFNLDDLTLQVK